MAIRPGLFGGIRQGGTFERDAESGFGSTLVGAGAPAFDPVWGSLGAPTGPAAGVDPWESSCSDTDAGPVVEVEVLGDGFQILGKICTGSFPRVSDWLNMQSGFIQVQDASISHLGHANIPDPDSQKGTLWVRLDQVVLVAERNSTVPAGPGGLVVQKQKRRVTIVTPGYSLRGFLHIHAYGSLKQFLETPEPHFIPITDLLVRWTNDPALVGRFGFALVNRQQLISLLDERPAGGEGAEAGSEDLLDRRIGAA